MMSLLAVEAQMQMEDASQFCLKWMGQYIFVIKELPHEDDIQIITF